MATPFPKEQIQHWLTPENIRRALRVWNTARQMGELPLVELCIVEQQRVLSGYSDTAGGLGLALREVLHKAIESLRPAGEMVDAKEKRWRPYLIITGQYLHARSPDWVAATLHISRRTYYNDQEHALQLVADRLWQWEEALYGDTEGEPQTSKEEIGAVLGRPFLAPPCGHVLVGRDDLLAEIKGRLLAQTGVLALCGLPGVGKTALALALAHDEELQSRFPDGILWAGLGQQVDVLAWLGQWAAALGMPAAQVARCASVVERARAVYQVIGSRRMLLVMDDVWRIEDALALKVGGAGCVHVLTTRLPNLAVDFAGVNVTPVPELDGDHSMNLLSMLVPQVLAAEQEASLQLVQAVGGLPLALMLVGRHLQRQELLARRWQEQSVSHRRIRRALEQLQAAEMRLRLAQPQSPLDQHPGLPVEQPLSLQAAIALSDRALSPEARQALRHLALFSPKPNTFSEAAALATTASDAAVLDELADHGLLEYGGFERYSIHQTIRDYAALDGTYQAAQRRFAAYFCRYVHEHAGDFERLDLELNNLLSAFAGIEAEEWRSFALSLHALQPFLMGRGLYTVAEDLLGRALDMLPVESEAIRFDLLLDRESVCEMRGKRENQASDLQTLGELAERLGGGRYKALVLLRQANYNALIGNYAAAVQASQQSIVLAETCGAVEIRANAYLWCGQALWRLAEYRRAAECFEQSLALARMVQLLSVEADSLRGLGNVQLLRGAYAQAQAFYEQSLAMVRMMTDRRGESNSLLNLGVVTLEQGAYEAAHDYYEQALLVARYCGDRRIESLALGNLAEINFRQGHLREARQFYGQTYTLFVEIGDRYGAANVSANLGEVLLRAGEYALAEKNLTAALQGYRQIGDRRGESLTLSIQSMLYLALERERDAHTCGLSAWQIARQVDATPVMANAQAHLAQVLTHLGDLAGAEAACLQALALWRGLGKEAHSSAVMAQMAEISLVRGDLLAALAWASEVLRFSEGNTLDFTLDPARVALICYRVLVICQDRRAQTVLHNAVAQVLRQAEQMDADEREEWLEKVSSHRALLQVWREAKA